MIFSGQFRSCSGKVPLDRMMSSVAALLLALVMAAHTARAHEVSPAVADVTLGADAMAMELKLVLESPTAGIDLEGLLDTNDAENAADYDRLRTLDPIALEAAFRRAWPGIRDRIMIRAGEILVVPEIVAVDVPPVANTEIARISTLRLAAALPPDGSDVVIGWDGSLGPLVLRQVGIEDGYTGYLTNGALSDPISREEADDQTALEAFVTYVAVGFDHIVPKGLDHMLFVLGLFFLALRMGPLLWQVSAFTLAHTVTLALGALEIVRIPPEIVEPLIAASIVYVGVENVLTKELTPWRPVVVFFFGLLHGLGFASVLSDFGLGASHFVPKLIGFNIGVEFGQLAVIAVAFLAVGIWFGHSTWYKAWIANPASVMIALVGSIWVVERTLL